MCLSIVAMEMFPSRLAASSLLYKCWSPDCSVAVLLIACSSRYCRVPAKKSRLLSSEKLTYNVVVQGSRMKNKVVYRTDKEAKSWRLPEAKINLDELLQVPEGFTDEH